MTIGYHPPDLILDEFKTTGGETPLMKAAEAGSLETVQELLILGCDPRHINNFNRNAKHQAMSSGNKDLIELLDNYIKELNEYE